MSHAWGLFDLMGSSYCMIFVVESRGETLESCNIFFLSLFLNRLIGTWHIVLSILANYKFWCS